MASQSCGAGRVWTKTPTGWAIHVSDARQGDTEEGGNARGPVTRRTSRLTPGRLMLTPWEMARASMGPDSLAGVRWRSATMRRQENQQETRWAW